MGAINKEHLLKKKRYKNKYKHRKLISKTEVTNVSRINKEQKVLQWIELLNFQMPSFIRQLLVHTTQ